MRRMVIVEINAESGEVLLELLADAGREFLRRHAEFTRLYHDWRAVCVARTHVGACMAAELLEAHPDIGLDVLDEMPHVNGAVRVRQGARHEDLSGRCGHETRLCHGPGL